MSDLIKGCDGARVNQLMTVEAVAEYLQLAPKTVYQNWRTWGLTGVRIGGGTNGALRFRRKDIETLANRWETK